MAEKQKRPPARKPKTKKQSELSSDLDLDIHPELEKRLAVLMRSEQSFSGPVPSAEMAERYEKIQSGSAGRFLTMAEKEQDLHHHREMKSLSNDTKRIWTEQLMYLLFFGILLFAFWTGNPWAATVIFGIGITVHKLKIDWSRSLND